MVTIDTRCFPQESKLRVKADIKASIYDVETTVKIFMGDKPFRPAPNTLYIVEPQIQQTFKQPYFVTR